MEDDLKQDSLRVADRLRGLCSRREYPCSDILKKAVAALDGDHAEAEKVLALLKEEKYVDDRRYAAAFARDKASISGWGEIKIRHMLMAKGVSREIIDESLEEIDAGKASARLSKILEVKARSLREDPQKRLKLLRFALGRGYSYDEVVNVIDDLSLQS